MGIIRHLFYEQLFSKINNPKRLKQVYEKVKKNPKLTKRGRKALLFFYNLRLDELDNPDYWDKVGTKGLRENKNIGMKAKLVKESLNESSQDNFEKLAAALEKHRIPCKLVMSEFRGKTELDILCGWDYPEKLARKCDDVMAEVGVQAEVSADMGGGKILNSRRIAGGPRSYSRSQGRWG